MASPVPLLADAAGGISLAVWALGRGEGAPYESLTILAIVVMNALLGLDIAAGETSL